ncbi:MAG TPA: TetR/AcrR family transcriptional regulator [Acidobacteriaceae bacterium]|nr:TetR/AcrR family transcriptional regulator [Acidobacteriaceae bacterium]
MSKGQITRERIVAAAAPVFNQKGYAGTSLADLMEATGLEKGGIYRHFDSKQALAEDAFDYAWGLATALRFDGLDQIPNAVDKIAHFIVSFRDRRTGLPGGCPLLNTAVDADDSNPQLKARARAALDCWLNSLESIFKQGQRDRQVSSRIDPAQQAQLIIATLEGALFLSRLTHDQAPLHAAAAHLIDHLEASVRTPRRANLAAKPPRTQKSRRPTAATASQQLRSSTGKPRR